MVRAFRSTSNEIALGRARLDMQTQVRMVTETLRRDLQHATCLPRPRSASDERSGFFEFVEGEHIDKDHTLGAQNSYMGDHDDILALTVRSDGQPFQGYFNGTRIESNLAEVIWWCHHVDTSGDGEVQYDEPVHLYRRVLLIRPDLDPQTIQANYPTLNHFYVGHNDGATVFPANDVSVRDEGGTWVANSLEDLADRRNRYAHDELNMPHELVRATLALRIFGTDQEPDGDNEDVTREGEDLVLPNCVAMDIRVFDPWVESFIPDPAEFGGAPPDIGQVIEMGDPGIDSAVTSWDPLTTHPQSYPQTGAYVDLAYDTTPVFTSTNRWFAGWPIENNYTFSDATWCTWWAAFEYDGIDNDGDGLIDEGSNGLDDNGADGIDNDGINGIDDPAEVAIDDIYELESPPPYFHPIRAIQISIRKLETNTNQVLQKTIKESFVPN
jgi:hypothetical protein